MTVQYNYYPKPSRSPPAITQLDPAEVSASVNYITIMGTNFSDVGENNKVYFD